MNSVASIVKMKQPFLDRTVCAKGRFDDGIMEIAYSDDGERNWTVVYIGIANPPGEHAVSFNSLIVAFGKLFLATSASKIYVSDDGGAAWSVSESVFTSTPYQWIHQIGDQLYAASEDILIRSPDKGLTWDYVNLPSENCGLDFAGAE